MRQSGVLCLQPRLEIGDGRYLSSMWFVPYGPEKKSRPPVRQSLICRSQQLLTGLARAKLT